MPCRTAVRIALLLLAGAAISIIVAWAATLAATDVEARGAGPAAGSLERVAAVRRSLSDPTPLLEEHAAGWPFPALASYTIHPHRMGPQEQLPALLRGLTLTESWAAGTTSALIPLRPLPFALAADALLLPGVRARATGSHPLATTIATIETTELTEQNSAESPNKHLAFVTLCATLPPSCG